MRWALTRAWLFASNRFGVLERRAPLRLWQDLPLRAVLSRNVPQSLDSYSKWRTEHAPPFLFDGHDLHGAGVVGKGSIAASELILQGEFPFFGYTRQLGFPPQWTRDPIGGDLMPKCHWSRIDELASADVKHCWEASRFGWAYALCRAYTCTRDSRYAEAFWSLVQSWCEQNPPNLGINWKCGQETSLRAMALTFASYCFAEDNSTTPARVALCVTALAAHGKRIEANIKYAISQKNNHSISEATGLWTIGLLFPELEGAHRWRETGRRVLEDESSRQVYPDGAYVQHSANYHRAMLHNLAWAIRLGDVNNAPFSENLRRNLRKATHFLHGVTDFDSGCAPNYGGNDGALVLPLTDCAFPDMRPVLQSCSILAEGARLYPPGPWDEEAMWMNGTALLASPSGPDRTTAELDASSGGCYTIRSEASWMMLRAATYKGRPAHADQLHVDLWWNGENVLCDPGSYSYNCEPPFEHGFAATRFHNTVTIDGQDQMTRLARFLWADWSSAQIFRFHGVGSVRGLEAVHNGYAKLGASHRRAIAHLDNATWLIVDDISGTGSHSVRQHWLLPDAPWTMNPSRRLDVQLTSGITRVHLFANVSCKVWITKGGEVVWGESPEYDSASSHGWSSRYYGRKDPALSLQVWCNAQLPVRYVTVVSLGSLLPVKVSEAADKLDIGLRGYRLSAVGQSPICEWCRP